jgi:hypothetical protein
MVISKSIFYSIADSATAGNSCLLSGRIASPGRDSPRNPGRVQPAEHRVRLVPESIDTSGPLGRAIVVIIGAIAELERT